MEQKTFSTTLQALRKEKKVTQEQLAAQLGVSPQAVSKWENGSYPEGDLVPKIADIFGVSIDYLYGRTDRDKSFEQVVFDRVSETVRKESEQKGRNDEHEELSKILRKIQWAGQISSWVNNRNYYEAPCDTKDCPKMSSAVFDNVVYSYMGLREDNDFFLCLRSPLEKTVFEDLFRDTERIRNLFRLLSDEGTMKVFAYLYSLKSDQYAGEETIAKATGISREKAREALEEIRKQLSTTYNSPICIVKEMTIDKENHLYGVDMSLGGLFMALMMIAKDYTDAPQGYSMQI
ncbi:MAG: helix-turn-helix transcriptional regulator, partial [Lachnospiraceae bacterium]|nr:helix-turn-helix transcriptional regulator [Lachnospiraceae bacterium]